VGPAIDLGYAPYMGTTPLCPKPVWQYLGFFFNCKLQFKEHVCFYTTRAFTQVCAMDMLGNSVRGLEPDQKRLLYRLCVVPVITYGFRLWYFKGARVKGLIKAMSQVQHTAARWICRNFHTTLGGGAECLSGLLPMHLTLHRLADRGATRMPMLAMSHPLRTILGEAMEGCHQAFFFFKSTIYYAVLDRSPRQTIQTKVQPPGIYMQDWKGNCCPDVALSSGDEPRPREAWARERPRKLGAQAPPQTSPSPRHRPPLTHRFLTCDHHLPPWEHPPHRFAQRLASSDGV
jgi:hypothetical protein